MEKINCAVKIVRWKKIKKRQYFTGVLKLLASPDVGKIVKSPNLTTLFDSAF